MACSFIPGHNIAVNVYYVDNESEIGVENLAAGAGASRRTKTQSKLRPVLQVKATRGETAASVMYRIHHYMVHNLGMALVSVGYTPHDLLYNGVNHNVHSLGNTAIGNIVNDPRSTLMIVGGDMAIANCCCLNMCIISCLTSTPHKPDVLKDPDYKYELSTMHR